VSVSVELSGGITRRRSEKKPNVNIPIHALCTMHSCILRACSYEQLCMFFFNFPSEHNIIKNGILFLFYQDIPAKEHNLQNCMNVS